MPFYIGEDMRIAVFADIHGNLQALNAILEDVSKENIDKIIFLGDAIAIGPKPRECLDVLIAKEVIFVPGNHELYYCIGPHIDGRMEDEEWEHQTWLVGELAGKHKEYLKSLPLTYNIECDGKKYSFCHFILARERSLFPFEKLQEVKDNGAENYIAFQDADYTFIGHEHKPFEASLNNKHIIDVGSSGCSKDNITCYTIIDTAADLIIKKELTFDREGLIADIMQKEYPERDFLSKIFFGIDI